jgi:hypothetical protein
MPDNQLPLTQSDAAPMATSRGQAPEPSQPPVAETPAPRTTSVAPTITYKVSDAHLEVEVAQTHREGEDFYKLGGGLELPLGPDGRYDPAQLEGALAALTVVAARIENVVSQAWLSKRQQLRADRARTALTVKLRDAMQSICVPPAEMEAALLEFFGGMPESHADYQVTLGKIAAMRIGTDRPTGWRWALPAPSRKTVVPAHRPIQPGGRSAAASQAARNNPGSTVAAPAAASAPPTAPAVA